MAIFKNNIVQSADAESFWTKMKASGKLKEGEDYQEKTIRVNSLTSPDCWRDIDESNVLKVPMGWWFGWLSTTDQWTLDAKHRALFGPGGIGGTPASGEFFDPGAQQGQLIGYYPNSKKFLTELLGKKWRFEGYFPDGYSNVNVFAEPLELRFFMNDVLPKRSGRAKNSPYLDNKGWITCRMLLLNLGAIKKKLPAYFNPDALPDRGWR